MAENQQKWALAWKEAAEDVLKRRRAADNEWMASAKKMDAMSNTLEFKRFHSMIKKYKGLRQMLRFGQWHAFIAMFLWYCADLNYFFCRFFWFLC